jgi:tetratricopeptide (TPR) repeat protein
MPLIQKCLGAAAMVLVMLGNQPPALAIDNDRAIDDSRPDKLALIQLLKDERYDDLNRAIVGFQGEFEAGQRTQRGINAALNAFAHASPHIQGNLDGWIASHPTSAIAHAARGIYFANLGWIARSSSFARINARQRAESSRLYARARRDLEKAIELDPLLSQAYVWLMGYHQVRGNLSAMESVMEAALVNLSDFFSVYISYFLSLQTRRIDSLETSAKFMQRMADHFPDDPRYRTSDAKFRFLMALVLRQRGANEAAREQLDAAIAEKRAPDFILARARVLSDLGEHDLALKDYLEVYYEFSGYAQILNEIGHEYAVLDQPDEAVRYKTMAVNLDPYNPELLYSRALVLRNADRPAEAVADIQKMLVYGSNDPWVHTGRGKFFGMRPKFNFPGWPGNVEMERLAYETAIKMNPEEPENWLGYAHALLTQGDCRARHVYAKFEELCEARGTCNNYGYTMDPRTMQLVGCTM